MSTRIAGVIGFSMMLLFDPNSGLRSNGYQMDWGNVPESYRQGTFKVKTNGAVTGGRNELVKLVYALATGGYSILTYNAIPTGHIAYSGTAATHAASIQAALDAHASIGPGNSRVSVGPGSGEIYVEFTGALGLLDQSAITADATNLTSGSTATITVSVPITGSPSPTTITVDALPSDLQNGTLLDFGAGALAEVTAGALTGAVTVYIKDLAVNIPDNTEATVPGFGPKVVPSGTVMGKAGSSDGRKIFPRVLTTNPGFGILIEDAVEGLRSDAVTGYGVYEGGGFWENRLPDAVANGGTLPSAMKTELGVTFKYKTAEDNAATL